MPRARLGVVVPVPPPVAVEVDALRRAVGDPALGRVHAHVTLLAPQNVRVEHIDEVAAHLRAVAATAGPLVATLGPAATFAPATPVLHLPVGPAVAVAGLDRLQAALRAGPMDRAALHPFVPHVTLADGLDEDDLGAGVRLLGGYRAEVVFDRVELLREEVGPAGRRWRPIADAVLDLPHVVGRGGLPLELQVGEVLDPAAAAFAARERAVVDRDVFGPACRPRQPFALTARRHGEVVGVATGWTWDDLCWLSELVVGAAVRREGVGGHLLRMVEHLAAERSCRRMGLRAVVGEPAEAMYRRRGWVEEARMPRWWWGRDVVQLGRPVA